MFFYLFPTAGDSAKNNTVRVFVKAYDRLGASVMVEKTVTVNPKVFSLAELQDLQTSGDSLEESGDLENQLGEVLDLFPSHAMLGKSSLKPSKCIRLLPSN